MIDEDRKLLTEWRGECWHDCENDETCSLCGKTLRGFYFGIHRTFTTPDDFFAVKRKLVEKGEFIKFEEWCYMKWDQQWPFNDLSHNLGEYADWLLDESRFCQLAADYLRREK